MGIPVESLQTRKQQFVRAAIWDAAIDLFADRGFEQTTVEQIAQAAGVSRRSFFRYFASKDDLMAQSVLEYGEAVSAAVRACPPDLPPLEVLRHTAREVAAIFAAHPRTYKTIRIASASPTARQAQLSRMADAEDLVVHAYAARCPRQDDVAPRLLAGLTFSVMSLAFRLWYRNGGQEIGAAVEHVLATLTGLAAGELSS